MKPTRTFSSFRLATLSVLFSGASFAVDIPILNDSFESPPVAQGTPGTSPANWSSHGGAIMGFEAYAYYPFIGDTDDDDFLNPPPDGSQVLLIEFVTPGKGVFQQLGSTFQAGSQYSLSVKVGSSVYYNFPGFPGYQIELVAGDTVLDTASGNSSSVPLGGFITANLTYNFDIDHAPLDGEPLQIRLLSAGETLGAVAFDDVQLSALLANPVADAGGPYYLANPTVSLSLDGSDSLPSGTESITLYEWDLDNDGEFDDASGETPPAISFSDLQTLYGMGDGSNTIRVRVTDSDNKTAIAQATVELVTSTKYTGPNAGSNDTWNTASNWDNGVPQGDLDVVILAGKAPRAWGNATPVYTGNLTLQNTASLGIGYATTFQGSYNALGTPGVTKITMNPGTTIGTSTGGTPVIPEIQLLGDAKFVLGSSTGPGADARFNYPISGPYQLYLQGNSQGGNLANFNVPNSFNSIYAAGAPYVDGGLTIRGNAAGSLGTGNITIEKNRSTTASYAILQINAANAMADTATLSISGTTGTMLTMNDNDTIASFIFNGVVQPAGTYGSTSSSATYKFSWITGTGILTVAAPSVGYWDLNGATAGAGGFTPSGIWNAANTHWNSNSAGTGSVAAWTPGQTAIFSAGSDATGSYAVDVEGNQDIAGLIIRNGSVALTQGSGGNLRLTADGMISVGQGSSSIATPISQDASARSLNVTNVGTLTLSGDLSQTGGTTLHGGYLVLAGNNSAASGATTVNAGALFANSVNSIPGTTRNVTINSSGTLAFGSSFGSGNIQTALNNRIVTSSAGTIAANNYTSDSFDFNAAGLTAAYFGSLGDVNFTGSLTPQGTAYRLSGDGGTLTMANANAITGARSLTVRGSVALAANNNFNGATTVLTNGALSLFGSTTTSGITLNAASSLTVGNNGALGSGTLTLAGLSTLKAVGTVVTTNPVAANSDFSIAGSGTLTLGTTTINANRIITNIGSATTTFGSILNGASNLSLTVDGPGNTAVSGNLTLPNGNLTKNGSGTLTLNGANTYNITNINGGVLRLNGSAFGAGPTTLFAATLQLGSAANGGLPTGNITISSPSAVIQAVGDDRSISNSLILDNNLVFSGSQGLTINGKLTNNNANRTLTNNITSDKALTLGNVDLSQDANNRILTIGGSGNTVVNGVIQNGGGSPVSALVKSGSGSLTLNGANTYTGTTTMNANSGELAVNGSLGASSITIGSGSSFIINGTTGAGNVIINNGATLLGTGTIGGNTTIAVGGKLEFNLVSPAAGHDKLELAAGRTLTFSGSSQVKITGFASTGTYTLLTAPGGISGPLPSLSYPDEWVASLAINGNDLQLIVDYTGSFPDPPTLVSIADDKGGGPVEIFETITYTVTFNEDMNASTVTSSDFGNAGTATITYGPVTETTPGVFTIQVIATGPGTLQLRINQGATLRSALGLNLNTTSALLDDNTLDVVVPANGVLAVSTGDFTTVRDPGGPFIPLSKTYTLTNYGSQALDWSVAKTADWIDLSSPSSGNLAPEASTVVTVSANANAGFLEIGSYFDTVTFTNATNGRGNTTRGVSLTVNGEPVVVTLGNLNQTYDGTLKAVSITTNPTPIAYSLTYNGFADVPTDAGSYDIVATVTEPGYSGSASATLLINKASQSITFAALEPVGNDQTSITLTATSTSDLPVGFTSTNNNVATVTRNTVTIIGVGTTTITAAQAGDENYQAAASVSRVLTVTRTNPLAVPGGPYVASSSVDLALNGSGSLPSHNQTITSYEWDLDDSNDGGGAFTADVTGPTPPAITVATLQGTYGMIVGNNPIRLRVTDSAGKTSTVSTTVLVTAPLRWDFDANYANGQQDGGGGWLSNRWRDTASGVNVDWQFHVGRDAIFGNGGNGGAVTLPAPTSVGVITFNSFTGTYSLGSSGQNLTINGGITKAANSGAVTLTSPIILGGAQSWVINGGNLVQSSSATIDLGAHNLTIDNSALADLRYAAISGTGGIIKNGPGRLHLGPSATHTFEGGLTLNGGVTMMHGNILGSGNVTLNGGVLEAYWGTNFTSSLGDGVGQIRIIGGVSGFSQNGSGQSINVIFNNSASFEVVWGSPFFDPSVLAFQSPASQNGASAVLSNRVDLNGATRTIDVLGGSAGTAHATMSGVIRNSSTTPAGLVKVGTGRLNLNASNTFNGGMTLQEGTLQLGNVSGLGSSVGTLTIDGGLLNLNNMAAVTVGNLTGTGGTIANNGTGASTFTIGSGGGTGGNFQGAIANNTNAGSGSIALTKTGTGTITLSGINTYTGATNISQGRLFINGSTGTSPVSVANGAALGGTGTLGGSVTLASGAGIAPGASDSVGTLNVNNNVAVTSGIWNIDLNASTPAIDLLNIAGNLSLTGTQTLNLNVLSGTPSGTYTFATWTGTDPAPVSWNLSQASGTYWLGGANFLWDTLNNWSPSLVNSVAQSGKNLQLTVTPSLLGPISSSNIFIEPGFDVSLTGPTSGGSQTVNNLTVGQGLGINTATLTLQAGGNLTVTGATTVRSDGTLIATEAGLITPVLNVNGGSVTLGHAAGNVTTANVTAGMLTVNHVGAANLTAFLSDTGSLAGSAAVHQVNVIGGAPTFTGIATTMSVTGGGITTTGGTIGTFNSTTGAGTSTIGSGTTITTANVSAGTVNFNSTQNNGTLAVTGGTTNIGTGAKVATANFSAGTGTVNAANPLIITDQLRLAGNMTATLTGGTSFTAAGTNLANNSIARTLSLSGGTLSLSGAPSTQGAFVPLANIAATAANNQFGNITQTVEWDAMSLGTRAAPDKNATATNTYQQQWTPGAGNHWGKWDLDGTATNASFNIANVFWWQYSQGGLPTRGISRAKLYHSNMTTDPGVPGDENPNWTKFYDNSAGGSDFPLSGGLNNHNVTVSIDITPVEARWIGILPTTPSPQDGNGLSQILFSQPGPPAFLNLPATSVTATASSLLDLVSNSAAHNLASLNLTAGATTTALSLKNGATLTLNGDASNNAISATGEPGQTASILPDVTSPPSLIIAAGKNVSVDPGVALSVQSVISGGALTKIGTGDLTLTGTNTYSGTTAVNAGKLFINGNQSAATGNVSVAADATLGGTGTLGGHTTIAANGKLEFNLSTPADSHDPLNIASGKNFDFSGASELTINASGAAAPGTYVLVTGGNNITGTAPAILNLSPGCAATTSIVGNELRLVVTVIGDLTPPQLVSISNDKGGGPVLVNTLVTYTVTFSEDMNAATVDASDFGNALTTGNAPFTIDSVAEASSGVFRIEVTPTGVGSIQLQINAGAILKDVAGNDLTTTVALLDDTTINVQSSTADPFEDWAGLATFGDDENGDGVANGLAWVLGAATPDDAANGLLPTLDAKSDPDFVIFTFRRKDDANDDLNTVIAAQYGTTLTANDWETAIDDGMDIIITEDDNFHSADPGIDRVQVKLRKSVFAQNGRLFVRLGVSSAQ